jgi:hypothetical protein
MTEEKKSTTTLPSNSISAPEVKIAHGREVWWIRTGETLAPMATSASSATILDEASVIYSGALKRLAKR